MAMTDFTIIRRSLGSRPLGTITTILTVAVAVALLIVLLAMRDAGKRAFDRGGGNMHLFVAAGGVDPMAALLQGVFYTRLPQKSLTWAEFEQFKSRYPLEWAIPTQQGDSYQGFPVLATTPEFFSQFTPTPDGTWSFRAGRAFEGDFEVVLGAQVARATGLGLGDKIFFTHGMGTAGAHIHAEHGLLVTGVLEPTGTSHDRALFTSLMSSWILHAQDRLERQNPHAHDHDHDGDGVADHSAEECTHGHAIATAADVTDAERLITGMLVRVAGRGGNATAALPMVFDAIRRDPRFTVAQPNQEINRLFVIVGNVNTLLVAMAVVVMVSSGISIMLALYSSMDQRRRQVAVLRVLGASQPRIFGLVLTESAILGLLGAAAGIALGIVGMHAVANVLRDRLGVVVEPMLPSVVVAAAVVSTVLLASIAGLIPAIMAYRTSVARNLRPIG